MFKPAKYQTKLLKGIENKGIIIHYERGSAGNLVHRIIASHDPIYWSKLINNSYISESNPLKWPEKGFIEYFTPENLNMPVSRSVLTAICKRYFPNEFDIDLFLKTTQGLVRLKMISNLIGIDLTGIHNKYKDAKEVRRLAKNVLKDMLPKAEQLLEDLQKLEHRIEPNEEQKNDKNRH